MRDREETKMETIEVKQDLIERILKEPFISSKDK
jgi:hypothetical protein